MSALAGSIGGGASAFAQVPEPVATRAASAAPSPAVSANADTSLAVAPPEAASAALAADAGSMVAPATPVFYPGFEAGLRLGIGLPVGNAGKSFTGEARKLSDLATWRTPIWVDVAYRVSPGASYGLYGQFGFGGSGDACDSECDWSDLRLGVQGQWRLNPGADTDPWLGLGLGYESLAFQNFAARDPDLGIRARTRERLGGPELLLQGGLELRVEDTLRLGPFVAASVGSYIGDRYHCDFGATGCPGDSSVEGSAFHAWLGVGLSGRYSP